MDLRHCVIPAAGLGTRFLPATKALPKELLPVLDRPVIQWGVEEAVAAGAGEMVVVISDGKELIQQHFTVNRELEELLGARGKLEELEAVRAATTWRVHLGAPGRTAGPRPRGAVRRGRGR